VNVAQAIACSGIEPREARLLLAGASGFSQASLVASPERELPREVERTFLEYSARRARGEPVAYILGRREFYGLELAVGPAVLVPRPETELLVELALARLDERGPAGGPARVLELGTGCGAVALAIKRHRPAAEIAAVEASAAALALARRNAARHGLEVRFLHGRWFAPVAGERFDVIAANPPYVAEGDPHLAELRYEPREALVAGPDGLAAIREITRVAGSFLRAGGWLLLEHGTGQEGAVRALLAGAGLEAVATWPDLAGIGRVSGGRR
jgi:release factor glutamine methyltransferase